MAKQKVAKRPTRDEFVLEELGNQLTEAYQEESEIVLSVVGMGRAGKRLNKSNGFAYRQGPYQNRWGYY